MMGTSIEYLKKKIDLREISELITIYISFIYTNIRFKCMYIVQSIS